MKRVCDAKSSKCPKKAGLALLSREGREGYATGHSAGFLSFFFLFLFSFYDWV